MKKLKQNIIIYFKKYLYIIITSFILLITFFTFSGIIKILDKKYKFETLEDLSKYANFYNEEYNIENKDWSNPDFKNEYKSILKHSFITKLLVKTRIKNTPIWNIKEFDNLINRITTYRIDKKLKSPFNKIITLKQDAKVIIFGEMQACFHSIVRDLKELESQKIIDHNLKIIAPNTYIVSLGDVIDKGMFSLETLNILLLLLERNPEKMIYLRGNHEKNGYWRNFNTSAQIKTFFPKIFYEKEKNNLFDKIDNFFNTLPDTLIINIEKKDGDKIILSNEIKEKLYENNKNIKFMILGEESHELEKGINGLEFVGYERGITQWSLLSCQGVIYKKFFNFYNDSFVELIIKNSASKCILKFNYRDTRLNDKNFKHILYDPIFGLEIKNELKKSKNIYSIGSTTGLDGTIAAESKERKAGLETAIYVNNENNKNLIIPVIFNDSYEPKKARANIEKLLNEYSIKTIVQPNGTPTLAFYIDMIKSGEIYVFFPCTGAVKFRDKEIKNIIHFGASYNDQAKTSINYLVKKHGLTNFAIFYQDDEFGAPMAKAAHDELKRLGINNWTDLPHSKKQANFKEIIEKIKLVEPESIALFSTEFATRQFITLLKPEFFSGKIIFGESSLFSDTFKKFLNYKGIEFVLTTIVPDPDKSELEIAKEFRKNIFRNGKKTSLNAFESYIIGSLISDAINKVESPATPEKIMQYFEKMKNYKFKGLTLTFDPETRVINQPVWLRTIENNCIKYNF